jgi:hypothetical protein
MKRFLSIFVIVLVVAVLALAPTLQVSANGGSHGNQGNHGGQQGNQGNHGGQQGNQDQHGNNGNGQNHDNPGLDNGRKLHYKGVIATVDAAGMSLTLADGSTLSVVFDAETLFKIPTLGGGGTVADLLPGMQVSVQAKMVDTSLVARKVMVVPGKPARLHRVGEVTAYTAGESISILAKDGQTYTFKLAENVKILPAERADLLVVGAWVTIISPRDVTQVEPVALGIVVHPAAPDEDGAD